MQILGPQKSRFELRRPAISVKNEAASREVLQIVKNEGKNDFQAAAASFEQAEQVQSHESTAGPTVSSLWSSAEGRRR